VVDALADLARDAQPRDGGVAAIADGLVVREIGRAMLVGMDGDFDERPAQVGRAGFGEMAAAAGFAGLVDDRVEPGQTGDLSATVEPACLADLGEQVAGENRPDPVDRLQRLAALVGAGEAA